MKNFVNFIPKKGYEHLTINDLKGMHVATHWNVRDKTFSIVQMNSRYSEGRVIGYSNYLTLENCYPFVKRSEQVKVQEGGHKTRHAFIVGNIVDFNINAFSNIVYYNPQLLDSFVDKVTYKEHGVIQYLKSMDRVGLATVQSKKIPLVTYNKGSYENNLIQTLTS
jgi:hypothetical protein